VVQGYGGGNVLVQVPAPVFRNVILQISEDDATKLFVAGSGTEEGRAAFGDRYLEGRVNREF
jgi:hypothetical protein